MTEEETKNTQEEEQQDTVVSDSAADEDAANEALTEESDEEKDPLQTALEEIEQLKTQMLYKTAEFDNYRKRTLKEKAELILNGG